MTKRTQEKPDSNAKAAERKRVLEESLPLLRTRLLAAKSQRELNEVEADKAHKASHDFVYQYALGDASKLLGEHRAKFDALQKDADEKENALSQAKREEEDFLAEMRAATDELKSLCYAPGLAETLALQEAIAEAGKKIEILHGEIAAQEGIIASAKASIPAASDLALRRENLLAEIVTGEAKEADLAELDKAIEEEKRAIAEATAGVEERIERSRQAIAGLKRKVAQAEGERGTLNSSKPEVLLRFFFGQAEEVYEKYQGLAEELSACYGQIVALDGLVREYDSSARTFIGPFHHEIEVPGFYMHHRVRHFSGEPLVSLKNFRAVDAVAAEKTILRGLGVTL